MTTILCSKCKQTKHKSLYYRNGIKLHSICKKCRKEIQKKYYIRAKDKYKKTARAWRIKNPNYQKEYGKKYSQDHKERINQYNKEYWKTNKEEIKKKRWEKQMMLLRRQNQF